MFVKHHLLIESTFFFNGNVATKLPVFDELK